MSRRHRNREHSFIGIKLALYGVRRKSPSSFLREKEHPLIRVGDSPSSFSSRIRIVFRSGNDGVWNKVCLFWYGRFCSNRFGLLDEIVRERVSRISQTKKFCSLWRIRRKMRKDNRAKMIIMRAIERSNARR